MAASSFDPSSTYLHLHGGSAERLPVDERFWPSVFSGKRPLPGWFGGLFAYLPPEPGSGPTQTECHPEGEELHVCFSGTVTVVLERDDEDERIELTPGRACVIPAGVWHRLEATQASRVLTFTFGEGTEHRAGG